MYQLLVRLFIAAALLDFGHTLLNPAELTSRSGLERLDRATRQVLRIDWKPISIFPEVAERVRKYSQTEKSGGQK